MSRLIAGRVQKLFRKIRLTYADNNDMTKLDQAKINDIIKIYIKDSLDIDESIRINRSVPYLCIQPEEVKSIYMNEL